MLFNSFEFMFVFLPITLFLFYFLGYYQHTKLALSVLVIASLVFYSYWDIRYLPLLLGSILFNFMASKIINKRPSKKILALAIIMNLMLLGYFKYMSFIVQNMNMVLETNIIIPNIILPLGISFFTFTQSAYLIDVYRGETKGYSFVQYTLFVTIFPHLIAGPILYHKSIIPQFDNPQLFKFNHRNFAHGITIFVAGLAKKVIIADNLSLWVKTVFDNPSNLSTIQAWVGALSYTFQLYFDFSGYSEMALGLGLMLNITLPVNFNSPYKAISIIEFWRKWHITLSNFLKNYLYIPLGGNRTGHHLRNIMITMFVGGIWHGAGWNFVIWGCLHGLYIVINHMWKKTLINTSDTLSWVLTFTSVVVAWVFFRSPSVAVSIEIIKAMFSLNGIGSVINFKYEIITILLLIFAIRLPNTLEMVKVLKPAPIIAVVCGILGFIILLMILQSSYISEFLYFQF